MFDFIKRVILFALWILCISYILALIVEVGNKLLRPLQYKLMGVAKRDVENYQMATYYSQKGLKCHRCFRYYPLDFRECPICKVKLSYIYSITERHKQDV